MKDLLKSGMKDNIIIFFEKLLFHCAAAFAWLAVILLWQSRRIFTTSAKTTRQKPHLHLTFLGRRRRIISQIHFKRIYAH